MDLEQRLDDTPARPSVEALIAELTAEGAVEPQVPESAPTARWHSAHDTLQ